MRKLLRSQTAARLKKLDREVRNAARKPEDADRIHDLRVSIRRLKQQLEVFAEWFEAEKVKTIRRHLRKLMNRCAAVRNCDVAVEVLQAPGGRAPSYWRASRNKGGALPGNWRASSNTGVARARSGNGAGISGCRERHPKRPLQRPPSACCRQMAEELFRAGRGAALPNSTRLRMHRLRLKAKEVRYTLEIFEPVYGRKTKQMLEALKGLQEKLGAINDCATTLEMIRRDRGAAVSVRRLAGEREAEFRTYWKEHFGSRERVRWKAVLRTADGKK